ncbi:hypothetical protein GTID1_12030 [Geobacillus thermodenitrificans]|jgi:hypothetical protein|uniref:hypothetical protein n=1 Tax=Geobacillus thermodenitrificans TaxID=33940 RepID=UPI000C05B20C|nr:hypothetical protein [Geobacillus thermodenitrificans]ATO37859.1 hypothetical protein GTID1_12030 [Geobacillus thermodenitrificans]
MAMTLHTRLINSFPFSKEKRAHVKIVVKKIDNTVPLVSNLFDISGNMDINEYVANIQGLVEKLDEQDKESDIRIKINREWLETTDEKILRSINLYY